MNVVRLDEKAASDEEARLQALRSLDILDTPAEEAFDRITQMAADLFDTPIALISLVDATRQWFKSSIGMDATETARDIAFCQHTIRNDHVMVVPDAAEDDRFNGNPLVLNDPNIRFYAGAPLRLASGLKMGSMCVIDTKPRRPLTEVERRRLATLAQIAVDEMELRVKTQQLEAAVSAAQSAAQVKSDFLANMSHELRTPLTSIIGFAGLLNASKDLGTRERHFAERIQVSSQTLLSLVNDVLDFAKLEAGRVEVALDEMAVEPFLNGILAQFRDQATTKGLELILRMDSGVPDIFRTDPHRARQVVTNLISNALKFTHAGCITLTVRPMGNGDLMIAVSDTGVGIAPDRLESVFDRFVQADSSISRKFGGTGLGLSISRRLAELMGGTLEVASTLGAGSTFTLRLPPGD
jgi:signal transduction histidine kinase